MKRRSSIAALAAVAALAAPLIVEAQTPISENFTGTSTTNQWYYFYNACLTASTATGVQPTTNSNGTAPSGGGTGGNLPGCVVNGTSSYGENLVGGYNGVSGNAQTLPDPQPSSTGQTYGALRFTNGYPYGYGQHGAIISALPFSTGSGVSITFKTVTYRGDSGGAGNDGADGISFFLMDASQVPNIGSWGGSLGYTCSNSNTPYTGMVGAYLGLGIDEFGNFLNGQNLMPGYSGSNTASGDNTALGYGYKPNRIGMRGVGNVAWSWLNANYPTYYPSTFNTSQQQSAVQATCQSGYVWNSSTGHAATISGANVAVADYTPIPNAYVELGSSLQIANEAAMSRPQATAILYSLKITQNGLLSLSYSTCPPSSTNSCAGPFPVLTSQSITASNGALPADFLFGFAGSTGGDTNIHEILCFTAAPSTSSSSGAGGSEKQSSKLETGAYAYFAYYNPANGWTGRVTANALSQNLTTGAIQIATTAQWDASCVLTGVATGATCTTTGVAGALAAETPANRVILTSSMPSSVGGASSAECFEWPGTSGVTCGGITTAQENALTAGDSSSGTCATAPTAYQNSDRLLYLRGVRNCEVNSSGVGMYRARKSVLADIVDSSPSWIGPPDAPYPAIWADRINSADTLTENSGQSYTTFSGTGTGGMETRMNVVYVGANDGMLHGFRTGYYNSSGSFNTTGTGNDGTEVLAYMPATVISGTAGQLIHVSGSSNATLDYSNTNYGHNYFVDATPGTGDLYYNGTWHSWVVSGLGAGGNAIFALDVTNPGLLSNPPTYSNFSESSAASIVIGEWNASTISCVATSNPNTSSCGKNLGNTYGTPQIRRLHDGNWGIIFGNGVGSTSGDGGIYVGVVSGATGPPAATIKFYYLSTSTGSATSPNGIAYVTPADLDGDHITDYVYAGDLQGNIWRFDLTSATESAWVVTPGPLFSTQPSGVAITTSSPAQQPITTQLVVASGSPTTGAEQQIMVLFGTGQKFPMTNTTPVSYAAGTQSLYGVWDWNLSASDGGSKGPGTGNPAGWNGLSTTAQYASLTRTGAGLTTMRPANLVYQTVTINASTQDREIATNSTICWAGSSGCTGASAKFGWYLNLPGSSEQVIYSPVLVEQALSVNTIQPAVQSQGSCTTVADSGFTYVLSAMTGGAFNTVFIPPGAAGQALINNPAYNDPIAIGMQTNATGSSFVVLNSTGTPYLVFQTNQAANTNGDTNGAPIGPNLPPNTTGKRISWIQRR
jgi:type IV pilus assembly protein PilY1